MLLLVVRHAQAGSKHGWGHDDALRPLTEEGAGQAAALVDFLAPYGPRRVVSSPLLRCVQTVQPLALRVGWTVETAAALEPTAGERAAAFVRTLTVDEGPIVVCIHGETIEVLQRHLGGAGSSSFAPGGAHEKGSVWALEALAGSVVSAVYFPPASLGAHLAPSAMEH